jgi:hypothetical protein
VRQQQEQQGPSLKDQVSFLIGLGQALAAPVHALLVVPGTPGSRFFGQHAAIGVVLMFLITTLGGGPYSAHVAVVAVILVCAALADHAMKRKKFEKQGTIIHSRYEGDWRINRSLATGLVFFIGLICLPAFQGLGIYLILASLGLAVSHDVNRMEWDARKRAIRDARIESEVLHEEMEQERK